MQNSEIRSRIDQGYFDGAQQCKKALHFINDLIEEIQAKKILEIGTGCGALTTLLGLKAKVITVDNRSNDIQFWDYKRGEGSIGKLDIIQHVGDSQTQEMADKVRDQYDLVLIDADHALKGGMLDWRLYQGMAPVVGIHDIITYKESVEGSNWFPHVFWKWLKQKDFFFTSEMVDNIAGGWGIIFKNV